jgi:hypothetical protein
VLGKLPVDQLTAPAATDLDARAVLAVLRDVADINTTAAKRRTSGSEYKTREITGLRGRTQPGWTEKHAVPGVPDLAKLGVQSNVEDGSPLVKRAKEHRRVIERRQDPTPKDFWRMPYRGVTPRSSGGRRI